jgi:integrase/recombinase XerD
MPAHHEIEETIDQYLSKVSIADKQPLFQSVNKAGTALTGRALNRHNAWAAIRKRARNAGFLTLVGCHTWRATGVTVYLENGGRLEHAQQMAAYESPRTTVFSRNARRHWHGFPAAAGRYVSCCPRQVSAFFSGIPP